MLGGRWPENTMRVDRASSWGNPFVMGIDGDRDEVCNKFEVYAKHRLKMQPDWLLALRGKDLACWCAPLRCHAETLLKMANKEKS